MVKDILVSDLLNERAMEWDVKKDSELTNTILRDLVDTLEANPDRLYLCANEIGYTERAFILKFSDDWKAFMNPIFQVKDNLKLVREYNPIDKKQYIIPRYTDVTICYQNSMGKVEAVKFNDSASAIVSHAMDVLEGLQTSDYGLEVVEEFDTASPEEQAQVLNEYLKSLNKFKEDLDSDLSNSDEETKKEWDGFKFMKAVSDGKVELYKPENKSPIINRKQRRFFEKLAKKFRRRKR